ncbi:MAG TPA: GAF domain-containing protein [Candidatus Baltobacteraceae bacterium]|nr:GAF domain-containing protein [Candidatus Baltobacteraceae bacterium]
MNHVSRADGIRFSYGFEAAGWLLTLLLGSLIFLLPQAASPGRTPKLAFAVALLAVANVLFHRVMPETSQGPFAYVKEDKALVVSLAMVVLLSAYLYAVPEASDALTYLYLIPLFASTLVLHENVVMAEALFSLLAMLFLHAAAWVRGPFWEGDFVLRLVIFSVASVCLVLVTRVLRQAFGRADRLSGELSLRLDQLQVINMLVRQSEFTSQIDRLATRTGEIIADAIDSERHAVFVLDGEGAGLRRVGEDAGSGHFDRELMAVDGNLQLLRGVLETGASRVFGDEPGGVDSLIGNSRIRNMLVVPLRVRDASIGLLCLVNHRASRFGDEDVHYCELLAGFVATMMNAALLLQKTVEERKTVERMAKLMVGREIKMRELKGRIKEGQDI